MERGAPRHHGRRSSSFHGPRKHARPASDTTRRVALPWVDHSFGWWQLARDFDAHLELVKTGAGVVGNCVTTDDTFGSGRVEPTPRPAAVGTEPTPHFAQNVSNALVLCSPAVVTCTKLKTVAMPHAERPTKIEPFFYFCAPVPRAASAHAGTSPHRKFEVDVIVGVDFGAPHRRMRNGGHQARNRARGHCPRMESGGEDAG